ncbi:hypothetical protein Nos7524_3216 [Nostoc sp. PCC 7524]|uniref:D-Ala-D-Ala carboxypeptidase family metallohydrolase n=1 Tax=Nostoc sp. (strain ATCC 29411 / PCC 7524) TaxID=28072 RepID=UPI00029ED8B2|nr:D-Ala-D-Ala carboxypeptidase family metallohydrolase [Nostoc sp. PCC 7524]AFY49016.1 hypothetical protein Nos7524_3216 [Nostoc sp. PCC 7524]
MNKFPKLNEVVDRNLVIELDKAPKELVKEIQTKLKLKGLYNYEVDGIVGNLTRKAFAEFKESVWLSHPTLIGSSVAANLLEIGEHRVSEQTQVSNYSPLTISRTGKSMRLPNGNTVFENEAVIEGISLTWGEVTKGCTRVPENNQIVSNIIETAKLFGEIRDKWGSPIIITSGYRPPAINRAVGGASKSQHIIGRALDIRNSTGDIYKLYDLILGVMRARGTGGLGRGMRLSFCHIDTRNNSLVIFDY